GGYGAFELDDVDRDALFASLNMRITSTQLARLPGCQAALFKAMIAGLLQLLAGLLGGTQFVALRLLVALHCLTQRGDCTPAELQFVTTLLREGRPAPQAAPPQPSVSISPQQQAQPPTQPSGQQQQQQQQAYERHRQAATLLDMVLDGGAPGAHGGPSPGLSFPSWPTEADLADLGWLEASYPTHAFVGIRSAVAAAPQQWRAALVRDDLSRPAAVASAIARHRMQAIVQQTAAASAVASNAAAAPSAQTPSNSSSSEREGEQQPGAESDPSRPKQATVGPSLVQLATAAGAALHSLANISAPAGPSAAPNPSHNSLNPWASPQQSAAAAPIRAMGLGGSQAAVAWRQLLSSDALQPSLPPVPRPTQPAGLPGPSAITTSPRQGLRQPEGALPEHWAAARLRSPLHWFLLAALAGPTSRLGPAAEWFAEVVLGTPRACPTPGERLVVGLLTQPATTPLLLACNGCDDVLVAVQQAQTLVGPGGASTVAPSTSSKDGAPQALSLPSSPSLPPAPSALSRPVTGEHPGAHTSQADGVPQQPGEAGHQAACAQSSAHEAPSLDTLAVPREPLLDSSGVWAGLSVAPDSRLASPPLLVHYWDASRFEDIAALLLRALRSNAWLLLLNVASAPAHQVMHLLDLLATKEYLVRGADVGFRLLLALPEAALARLPPPTCNRGLRLVLEPCASLHASMRGMVQTLAHSSSAYVGFLVPAADRDLQLTSLGVLLAMASLSQSLVAGASAALAPSAHGAAASSGQQLGSPWGRWDMLHALHLARLVVADPDNKAGRQSGSRPMGQGDGFAPPSQAEHLARLQKLLLADVFLPACSAPHLMPHVVTAVCSLVASNVLQADYPLHCLLPDGDADAVGDRGLPQTVAWPYQVTKLHEATNCLARVFGLENVAISSLAAAYLHRMALSAATAQQPAASSATADATTAPANLKSAEAEVSSEGRAPHPAVPPAPEAAGPLPAGAEHPRPDLLAVALRNHQWNLPASLAGQGRWPLALVLHYHGCSPSALAVDGSAVLRMLLAQLTRPMPGIAGCWPTPAPLVAAATAATTWRHVVGTHTSDSPGPSGPTSQCQAEIVAGGEAQGAHTARAVGSSHPASQPPQLLAQRHMMLHGMEKPLIAKGGIAGGCQPSWSGAYQAAPVAAAAAMADEAAGHTSACIAVACVSSVGPHMLLPLCHHLLPPPSYSPPLGPVAYQQRGSANGSSLVGSAPPSPSTPQGRRAHARPEAHQLPTSFSWPLLQPSSPLAPASIHPSCGQTWQRQQLARLALLLPPLASWVAACRTSACLLLQGLSSQVRADTARPRGLACGLDSLMAECLAAEAAALHQALARAQSALQLLSQSGWEPRLVGTASLAVCRSLATGCVPLTWAVTPSGEGGSGSGDSGWAKSGKVAGLGASGLLPLSTWVRSIERRLALLFASVGPPLPPDTPLSAGHMGMAIGPGTNNSVLPLQALCLPMAPLAVLVRAHAQEHCVQLAHVAVRALPQPPPSRTTASTSGQVSTGRAVGGMNQAAAEQSKAGVGVGARHGLLVSGMLLRDASLHDNTSDRESGVGWLPPLKHPTVVVTAAEGAAVRPVGPRSSDLAPKGGVASPSGTSAAPLILAEVQPAAGALSQCPVLQLVPVFADPRLARPSRSSQASSRPGSTSTPSRLDSPGLSSGVANSLAFMSQVGFGAFGGAVLGKGAGLTGAGTMRALSSHTGAVEGGSNTPAVGPGATHTLLLPLVSGPLQAVVGQPCAALLVDARQPYHMYDALRDSALGGALYG
ncbi:hypothetical protein QJQ45_019325, partial [Haematococcus lacustris]